LQFSSAGIWALGFLFIIFTILISRYLGPGLSLHHIRHPHLQVFGRMHRYPQDQNIFFTNRLLNYNFFCSGASSRSPTTMKMRNTSPPRLSETWRLEASLLSIVYIKYHLHKKTTKNILFFKVFCS
jgi:hypothetical protein